jgi:hypothetical protein
MKQFWCLFLVGAISCSWAGCGQGGVEPPTEQEEQEDLDSQEEMMKDAGTT